MKLALLSTALLAACSNEADLVIELRRAVASTELIIGICDVEHPEDCDAPTTLAGGSLTSELGIYFDAPIVPPLRLRLGATTPQACGVVEIDPALAPDLVVVQFPTTDGADLVVERCPTCRLMGCPPPS